VNLNKITFKTFTGSVPVFLDPPLMEGLGLDYMACSCMS